MMTEDMKEADGVAEVSSDILGLATFDEIGARPPV
jgi:hypothetical protein